jgi:hypothetical protein
MADESRGNPVAGRRAVPAAVLAALLLAAVGGGIYLAAGQRGATQHDEPQGTDGGPAARGPADAQWQSAEPPAQSDAPRAFEGKVVRPAAPGGTPGGLVLVPADGGPARPIVEDDGSRALVLDGRLRDRPVRLTAVPDPGTGALRVVCVQTIVDGVVNDVDYWCDICAISLTRPGPCYCCGQETVLRERPAR